VIQRFQIFSRIVSVNNLAYHSAGGHDPNRAKDWPWLPLFGYTALRVTGARKSAAPRCGLVEDLASTSLRVQCALARDDPKRGHRQSFPGLALNADISWQTTCHCRCAKRVYSIFVQSSLCRVPHTRSVRGRSRPSQGYRQ
jgi:hypothetical protein